MARSFVPGLPLRLQPPPGFHLRLPLPRLGLTFGRGLFPRLLFLLPLFRQFGCLLFPQRFRSLPSFLLQLGLSFPFRLPLGFLSRQVFLPQSFPFSRFLPGLLPGRQLGFGCRGSLHQQAPWQLRRQPAQPRRVRLPAQSGVGPLRRRPHRRHRPRQGHRLVDARHLPQQERPFTRHVGGLDLVERQRRHRRHREAHLLPGRPVALRLEAQVHQPELRRQSGLDRSLAPPRRAMGGFRETRHSASKTGRSRASVPP